MVTAVFAKTLDKSKYSTWLISKSRNFSLNTSHKNLRSRIILFYFRDAKEVGTLIEGGVSSKENGVARTERQTGKNETVNDQPLEGAPYSLTSQKQKKKTDSKQLSQLDSSNMHQRST
jgi:hypothetical protein